MPCWHRVGIHQIRTNPPVAMVDINFFFCGNMTVVFACKSIHVKDDIFRATQLNHRLSERRIADKSIMNVFIMFLSTPLLNLFCCVEFSATFLPVLVTVWPAFPDVEVRDGEQIQHGRDVLFVFCCIILQEVSARSSIRGFHMLCSKLSSELELIDTYEVGLSLHRRYNQAL